MDAEKNESGFADPMSDIELSQYMNTDAARWAEQWVARARRLPVGEVIDEGWMISWFANAIMAGYDEGVAKEKGHRPGDQVPTRDIVSDSYRRRIHQRLKNIREMGLELQPQVRDAVILEELWDILGLNQLSATITTNAQISDNDDFDEAVR